MSSGRIPARSTSCSATTNTATSAAPARASFTLTRSSTSRRASAPPSSLRCARSFGRALLAAVAPSGLFFAHGSPPDTLRELADIDALDLDPDKNDPYGRSLLAGLLTCYGQRGDISARLLATVSRAGTPVRIVVHGHDRCEAGFFLEGGNQICPVVFGAPRENKRYLRLRLDARYERLEDLREDIELRRLHPSG